LGALSRRRFLAAVPLVTAVGVAFAGGLGAIRGLFPVGQAGQAGELGLGGPGRLGDHMIVHVRDLSTGEIAIMAGTTEVVYRDAELVARLVQGARRAATTGG
jgi:hypothetical protein